MRNAPSDSWEGVQEAVQGLRAELGRSQAQRVKKESLRAGARSLVQLYFREGRPDLIEVGFGEKDLARLDTEMQRLLRLASGPSQRTAYMEIFSRLRKLLQDVEAQRELRLGRRAEGMPATVAAISITEELIIRALESIVPSAALSYRQAIVDLADPNRLSFRGPANELREAFREVLDELAPDDEVAAEDGFSLEAGQTKPTQRQRVRYILRSQGLSGTARKVPEESVFLIEELTASLARSVYQSGSVTAHVSSRRRDVMQMKAYLDGLLADLLAIHA